MSTKLPKLGSDINAWITLNNYFNSIDEYINIVLNGNEIPTIKQGTRTTLYNIDTDTISDIISTGNNEYGAGDEIDYLTNQAIFEDTSDVVLKWGTTVRGVSLPSISDGTWYIYLSGSYDQDKTTVGQGTYNVSKNAPTYSVVKKGWYHAVNGHAIARFTVATSVVSDLIIMGDCLLIAAGDPQIDYTFTPGRVGQVWIDTTTDEESVYFSKGTVDENDWIQSGGGSNIAGIIQEYDTGWIENLLNSGSAPKWGGVELSEDGLANGNINHGFNTPLSKLRVELIISTDGTDSTSFIIPYASNTGLAQGISVYQVDLNNIKIVTNSNGFNYINESFTTVLLTNQPYYYKVKVYSFENTVSSGLVSTIKYETGWVENLINGGTTPKWNNVHLGSDGTQDSFVIHNLGCPLKDLDIKIYLSTDGTDSNSFELRTVNTNPSSTRGFTPYQIDQNSIKIQTGNDGISYIQDNGVELRLLTDAYYYNIVVTKKESQPTIQRTSYDTGYLENLLNAGSSAKWNDVEIGDDNTQNSNINHGLNCGLSNLLVKLIISTDGTDANSFEIGNGNNRSVNNGMSVFYFDSNNIKVQTGSDGITYLNDSGTTVGLTNQPYYYRIVIVKLF